MQSFVHPSSGMFRAALGFAVLLCVCLAARCAWGHCVANEWQKILASNEGNVWDHFGYSVSISGTRAIVGVPLDDIVSQDLHCNSGSAYLYRLDDNGTPNVPNDDFWVEVSIIFPSDSSESDEFGYSVGISGNTAIIGAPNDDDNGSRSGSVYIFDATTWQQLLKLLPDDGEAYDNFGWSIAISGTTAIIGALYDDDNGSQSGSAYLFDTTTGQQIGEKLLPDDGAAFDEFGCSVAISGTIAIVGARYDDDYGDNSGSAYLFDTTTGQQLHKLLPSPYGVAGHEFGNSVAISGTTAIVGARWDDDNGWHSGSACVFDTTTGEQTVKLLADDGAAFDEFGYSVAISGTTAIVGSPNEGDYPLNESGSVYVFRLNGSTWTEEAKLLASDGAASAYFGNSVAISGTTAIIGAYLDEESGSDDGAAYIFHGLSDTDEDGTLDICDFEFDGPVEIASIGEPTDVVSIDFTGSNGNDIAIAELGPVPSEPGYIVLLLNDGSGLNFEKKSTGVGVEPTAFVVGDFDGVNGPDVAVTNSADDDVRVLLNDGQGNGTFLPPNSDVDVGQFPSDIAAGDFNGDTFIDLAVTNRDDNNVMILSNDGTGTFTVTNTFGVGNAPSAILAADFNDDELIDLAVANEADNNVMIFLNTGARGFELHATIPVGLDPGVLEPEDLDDDQHIDMAVGNRGSDKVTLLINDGEANFEPMTLTVGEDPASIAIADLDVDGDEDILVVADTPDSRAVRVLRNDLNGGEELSFTLVTDLAEDPSLKLTATKDLNGNNLPDVIAVNGPAEGGPRSAGKGDEGSVRVLLNGLMICPGDLDGDWDVDTADLLQLLGCWGTDCGDVDFDGDTDTADLLALLAAWGDCP